MTAISATRHLGSINDPAVVNLCEELKAGEAPRHVLNSDALRGAGAGPA
jgi:hypothetical protein